MKKIDRTTKIGKADCVCDGCSGASVQAGNANPKNILFYRHSEDHS